MSDKMRWRYGETNPVVAAVDSATEVEIGDLLWLDGDDAKPAKLQADQGSEEANQSEFADNFLGVAMQRSLSGQTDTMRVATTGVFEFDCGSATFELGDPVGAAEASDTELANQQVKPVASLDLAIGRAARREPSATTTVLVDIVSQVMKGGVGGASWSGS